MLRVRRRSFALAVVMAATGVVPIFALNPSYLSQMPTVAQVQQKIHGSDPMDTAGRLVAAYWHLNHIVVWMRGMQPLRPTTPDEQRMESLYFNALTAIKQPMDAAVANDSKQRAKWAAAYGRYDTNPAFRDEIIRSLFAPQMQALVNVAVQTELAKEAARGGGRPGTGSTRPGFFSRMLASIANTSTSLFKLLVELLIVSWIAYRVWARFHFSQKAIYRRSNRESIAVFGDGDQASRERAILKAFDQPDFVFRHYGIVGRGMRRVSYVLMRSAKSFRQGDLEAFRFACVAFNRGLITEEDFHWFRYNAIYASGITEPSDARFLGPLPFFKRKEKAMKAARGGVSGVAAGHAGGNLESRAIAALQKLAIEHPDDPLYRDMQRRFIDGVYWLTEGEIERSAFKATQSKYALSFGVLEGTDTELTYSGEGSIMTIAPSRSGKTQCNVFPNLLRWHGPAVVLDIKGEIYEGTSRWRAQNVGPVIKFSPLDPDRTAKYNPLTGVRREKLYIWEDARFVADMMIVPNKNAGDHKFWEDRARDLLTAIIADMAYWNPPDQRPVSRLLSIVNRNGWGDFVDRLRNNPEVGTMQDEGESLAAAEGKTIDGILQTAKSSLSAWAGERIGMSTARSDWQPLDLRNGSNPTIYICLKPNEVTSYLSLLRVMIGQHIRALTAEIPPRGSAPILFLLDEMPQLGYMPPIESALDIGAQYGLRLWMFAQSVAQLRDAYSKADGMIGNCAVRSYMNCALQDGTAKMVAEQIGYRSGEHHGGKDSHAKTDKLVVEPPELAGPDYRELQIVLGVGSKPARVRKMYAWQDPKLAAIMGGLAAERAAGA